MHLCRILTPIRGYIVFGKGDDSHKRDKKKSFLILAVIMGIVSIIATVLVIVLGVYSKAKAYEVLLTLSPMVIGLISGYYLLKRGYSEGNG